MSAQCCKEFGIVYSIVCCNEFGSGSKNRCCCSLQPFT